MTVGSRNRSVRRTRTAFAFGEVRHTHHIAADKGADFAGLAIRVLKGIGRIETRRSVYIRECRSKYSSHSLASGARRAC